MRRIFPLKQAPLLALGFLAGCTGALNQENGLLGTELPDLAGPLPRHLEPSSVDVRPTAHDRSSWEVMILSVERRQVEVQPWYVTRPQLDTQTARSRGEFPTALSALELQGNGGDAALEGVVAPFQAVGDLLLSPIRIFIAPPGTTVRVPADAFELRPGDSSEAP